MSNSQSKSIIKIFATLLSVLGNIIIFCLFLFYPLYNKIWYLSDLAIHLIFGTMIVTGILVVLYRVWHYYKRYQRYRNHKKPKRKKPTIQSKKIAKKPSKYVVIKGLIYELYMSFLAVLFMVFLMAMTVGSLMTFYTTLFGAYRPTVITIVTEKYSKRESKGIGYYIKTDKFDKPLRLLDDIWQTIEVSNVLEIRQKESIFMTIIYQDDINNLSK